MLYYYDRNGIPIDRDTFFALLTNHEGLKRVAQTTCGRYWVSTVWLGLNHGWGDGPPLIFETMVFMDGKWTDMYMERYSTIQEAFIGHNDIKEMVLLLAALSDPGPLLAITSGGDGI